MAYNQRLALEELERDRKKAEEKLAFLAGIELDDLPFSVPCTTSTPKARPEGLSVSNRNMVTRRPSKIGGITQIFRFGGRNSSSSGLNQLSTAKNSSVNIAETDTGTAKSQALSDMTSIPPNAPPNVIVFGQAGAGKSSIVNMIAGKIVAAVSEDAVGCTLKSTRHEIQIPGGPAVALWDTAGLDEGANGSVDTKQAIENLYTLTRDMKDGVNLLVYCVTKKITNSTITNYNMFNALCEGKVPVALVVTNLELVENREAWWTKNMSSYKEAGIISVNHACIVATKGRKIDGRYMYEDDYQQSTTVVRKMIRDACLPIPWIREGKSWFIITVAKLTEIWLGGSSASEVSKTLYEGLKGNGFSVEDSLKMVQRVYPSFVPPKSRPT